MSVADVMYMRQAPFGSIGFGCQKVQNINCGADGSLDPVRVARQEQKCYDGSRINLERKK